MTTPEQLLARLDAIGRSLSQRPAALALLGLGSVGTETARLDAYSDLDFFAIVRQGTKHDYIQNLNWLSDVHPVAYAFLNTPDGYKLLFEDGIFCEFAVFEPPELIHIPFTAARVVWQAADFDDSLLRTQPAAAPRSKPVEWEVGEALTNLYVGLGRYHRGEKLSALRFIQGYALDRILSLAARVETAQAGLVDPFSSERRFEQRYPVVAEQMATFMQGYDHSRESALAILAFLEAHFAVNPALAARIRQLAGTP